MSGRRGMRKPAGWLSGLVVVLAFAVGLLGYEAGWWKGETPAAAPAASATVPKAGTATAAPGAALAPGEVEAVFLDVGQGDSILLTSGDAHVLVDGGDEGMGSVVLEELQRRGITRLDLVVASHPHADHIGGLDEVLQGMEVAEVYMPEAASTSVAFERLVTVIAEKDIPVHAPAPGEQKTLGQNDAMRLTFLGAQTDPDNLNNASLVMRMDTGHGSLMLTGDAESAAEDAVLSSGLPLQADVLKVGHHGSKTSTKAKFLQAVHPNVAVISVGQDNDYGHPTQTVLDRLEKAGIWVLRTDLSGTITCRFSQAGILVTPSRTTEGQAAA